MPVLVIVTGFRSTSGWNSAGEYGLDRFFGLRWTLAVSAIAVAVCDH